MRSEAAAQVLNCRQAVDDPKQTIGSDKWNLTIGR